MSEEPASRESAELLLRGYHAFVAGDLEAIGKELGITRERVRQLERDALDRLEHELDGIVTSDDLANAA